MYIVFFSLPAYSPSAALRCKCAAERVQVVPSGSNSSERSVTELTFLDCNGTSFCYTPGNGSCYYRMVGESSTYGYTVIFGCLAYEELRDECQPDNDYYCCARDDCNAYEGKLITHAH